MLHQVMKDISEVRKGMDTTQEIFEPLHQMIVMLKQHGVDVSGVQVAEKNVQVRCHHMVFGCSKLASSFVRRLSRSQRKR